MKTRILVLLVTGSIACSSPPPPRAPEPASVEPAEPAPVEPAPETIPEKSAERGNISISDRIKQAGSLGPTGEQVSTTSRGEQEATGTDEASWAKDRKVEIKIDD